MIKKCFLKYALLFLLITGLMFFMPNLTFSAQPGLDLNNDGTGVMTWTSDAQNPFTGLQHWVKVVDYDGITDDGSSHTVTVTYPDGSTVKTLVFNSKMDANSVIYEMYDSDISQPINAGTYTGNYVYLVTEVSSGDWTEATDYLDVNTVNPPDETKFSHTIVGTTPTFNWEEVQGGAINYRVRIYDEGGNNTIYRGSYVKSPPYTLPPGILSTNTVYKYRIEAFNHHQWFDWDNVGASNKISFETDSDEAQNPYMDLYSSGVGTWTDPAPFDTNTWFYVRIHDAQGVPGNIDSVKALLPDGVTEAILYLDYNESDTCGVYQGGYSGNIQEGTYTFTVVDKNGNSDTNTEVLTSNPIGYPSEASLQPANNTLIGGTGVSFDWDDVSGAAIYELKFYDKDFNYLFGIRTTESEYTLPPGILKEGSLYRYRIYTRREFYEDNADNGSTVPSFGIGNANTFITTKTNGTAAPSMNLDSYGAAVWHAPYPVTGSSVYWLEFYSMVTDSDGVPENIEKVEVIYPDGVTIRLLKYEDMPDWEANYYNYEIYTDPSLIPSGTYTFRVVDFDGNEVTLQDELPDVASNILPLVTGVTPADDTFTTITPKITWNSVSGASYYKVRIMSSWAYPTVHWSDKLTQPQYTVPNRILSLNTTYGYRIYAYRENEVDFFSCNSSWHLANYRFTTQQDAPTVTTGDATSVTTNTATLNGTVNPYGVSTTYYFEYGTTTSYGSNTVSADAGSGTIDVSVNANITGLSDSTTYHFRIVATNNIGTTYGNDATFTTTSVDEEDVSDEEEGGGSGDDGGGCFITTTGYGSSME